jgi:hypothetical protein
VLGGEGEIIAGASDAATGGAPGPVELRFRGHVAPEEALHAVRSRKNPHYVGDLAVVHTGLRSDKTKKLTCYSCKRRGCDHAKDLALHLHIPARPERSQTFEFWIDADTGVPMRNCVSDKPTPKDTWDRLAKKGHRHLCDRVDDWTTLWDDAGDPNQLDDDAFMSETNSDSERSEYGHDDESDQAEADTGAGPDSNFRAEAAPPPSPFPPPPLPPPPPPPARFVIPQYSRFAAVYTVCVIV